MLSLIATRTTAKPSSASTEPLYIGVDIGGSKILVASSLEGKKILNQSKIETPDSSKAGIAAIIKLIEEVAGEAPIHSIAVVAPGPLDLVHGHILNTPNMTWAETPVCELLKERFKVPVILENDANAAALAEATIGAAKGKPYVLYVTISTGVGTGMVINGKIYHGASDTEGGHMMIPAHDRTLPRSSEGASLEAEVSGRAIKRRFNRLGFQIPAQSHDWDVFAHDLSIGLYNLTLMMAPSIVVLGGGVSLHFDKFHGHLERHMKSLKPFYAAPPIVQAKLVEVAPIHGALILAARLG